MLTLCLRDCISISSLASEVAAPSTSVSFRHVQEETMAVDTGDVDDELVHDDEVHGDEDGDETKDDPEEVVEDNTTDTVALAKAPAVGIEVIMAV